MDSDKLVGVAQTSHLGEGCAPNHPEGAGVGVGCWVGLLTLQNVAGKQLPLEVTVTTILCSV